MSFKINDLRETKSETNRGARAAKEENGAKQQQY